MGNIRVFEETPIEEQLDWGTDSAGDDHSDLDDEIAESAGLDTGMYSDSKNCFNVWSILLVSQIMRGIRQL